MFSKSTYLHVPQVSPYVPLLLWLTLMEVKSCFITTTTMTCFPAIT
uniref:Truncated CYC n=1 Tax=Sinningia speciosa TaxID=121486 RepID=A0A2S1UFJ0_9LAMI|nr:truncated CYC [Sinningia speciosa]